MLPLLLLTFSDLSCLGVSSQSKRSPETVDHLQEHAGGVLMALGNHSSNFLIRWSCRSIIKHFPFLLVGKISFSFFLLPFLFYWEDFLFFFFFISLLSFFFTESFLFLSLELLFFLNMQLTFQPSWFLSLFHLMKKEESHLLFPDFPHFCCPLK